jgi:hypothetical protein
LDGTALDFLADQSVFPNPVQALVNPDVWAKGAFSAPSAAIHGDLNLENVLIQDDGALAFIDAEKARVGPLYWDIAFLVTWLAQVLVVDLLPHAHFNKMVSYALKLGTLPAIWCQGAATPNLRAAAEFDAFKNATDALFSGLGPMLRANAMFPAELNQKSFALSLAAAALARSYYELRQSGSGATQSAPAEHRQLSGRFFFALAGSALKTSGLIREEASSHPFFLGRQDTATQATTSTARDLKLENEASPGRTFWTQLVYEIATPHTPGSVPPGWSKVTALDVYGYFSKMRVDTDPRFHQRTKDLLVWEDVLDKYPLPVIYRLDLNVLKGCHEAELPKSDLRPQLESVDLILLPEKRGYLSLRFAGPSCGVGDYLKWASLRLFGSTVLERRQPRTDLPNATIAGLVAEVAVAMKEGRQPELAKMNSRENHRGTVAIFQYLLWKGVQDNGAVDPFGEQAWNLLSSFARPGEKVPKAGSIEPWIHSKAEATRYGMHEYGVTALASPAKAFNRETKPQVFLESNFFAWVLAMQLSRDPQVKAADVAACIEPEPRRFLFQKFVARLKPGVV